MPSFRIGDLVTFTYNGERTHDKYPKVLILHNNWRGKVHGLNFNYLTEQEINYIEAILNEDFAEEISKKDLRIKNHLEKVKTLRQNVNILNPHDFYVRFVKGFIMPRQWDPYRIYTPTKISFSKVVTTREVLLGKKKNHLFESYLNKFEMIKG